MKSKSKPRMSWMWSPLLWISGTRPPRPSRTVTSQSSWVVTTLKPSAPSLEWRDSCPTPRSSGLMLTSMPIPQSPHHPEMLMACHSLSFLAWSQCSRIGVVSTSRKTFATLELGHSKKMRHKWSKTTMCSCSSHMSAMSRKCKPLRKLSANISISTGHNLTRAHTGSHSTLTPLTRQHSSLQVLLKAMVSPWTSPRNFSKSTLLNP